MIKLLKGDCLEVMKSIEDNSIDAIICDPPYGTTACKWDSVIDFKLMWEQLNRIIKPNGAIVLFGSEPFSSALRMSNIKNYKYDWIWDKKFSGSIGIAKYQPMRTTERISVFYKKVKYYPQMIKRDKPITNGGNKCKSDSGQIKAPKKGYKKIYTEKYPIDILTYSVRSERGLHPTQKPIKLMEYLIKTYTNENETVLDFTMGSGSTGVACVNTNRNFIGIEQDENYYNIAVQRMAITDVI
jgi:DNA modification methylase